MRVEICFEDALQYDWFLIKDSIQFFKEEVPLTWGYDFARHPIGKASKFRREDDGAITAKLMFFENEYHKDVKILLKNHDIEPSIWANHVTDERHNDIRVVHKATLKAVVLIMSSAMPRPKEVSHAGE